MMGNKPVDWYTINNIAEIDSPHWCCIMTG